MLNKLQELKQELQQQESIKRFKHLEMIIDQDETLKQDYNMLKNLQKLMVQAEHKQSANLSAHTSNYQAQLDKVNQHILLSEYVDLVQTINEDLQLIQTIISEELNMDVD